MAAWLGTMKRWLIIVRLQLLCSNGLFFDVLVGNALHGYFSVWLQACGRNMLRQEYWQR